MMDITNILQHLFKKPALEEVSLASLQELVEKYPYFAPGHFLLAKKMKLENDSACEEQVQKTNLYFPNTLWLHHNLENSRPASDNALNNSSSVIPAEQTNSLAYTETKAEMANEVLRETEVSSNEAATPLVETVSATVTNSDEHLREEILAEQHHTNEDFSLGEHFVDTHFIEGLPIEELTAKEHIEEPFAQEIHTQESLNELSADKPYANELTIKEPLNETSYASESSIEESLHEKSYAKESSIEEPLHEKSYDSSMGESLHETSYTDESSVEKSITQKYATVDASLIESASFNNKDGENIQETTTSAPSGVQVLPGKPAFTKGELDFDPYHTIDYFASLGIRLSQDPRPDDKLGQQLKSFTAWLKTMRRLPEASGTETVEVNQADLNAHIEKIAAHSLVDREVITQAMAEVLVKQGNKEKATEIYHKLSLLNPGKSAYFAAKIEELKRY